MKSVRESETMRGAAAFFVAIAALPFLFFPAVSVAQSIQGDLRATIRAELLSDPRTSGLSEAQLDAIVDLLADEAQRRGMTVQDLAWRPAAPATFSSPSLAPENSCGALPAPFCALNQAFGLDGSSPVLPLLLGFASGLVILVVALMLERHHRAHVSHAAPPASPVSPPPSPQA